jgi:hypothetical protein
VKCLGRIGDPEACPPSLAPSTDLTEELDDEPRQVRVEATGIGGSKLVQRPPPGPPELARIELHGPPAIGVADVPEADVNVPGVQSTSHPLRHEQWLARQAGEQRRREPNLLAALAGHGRRRVLAGLHMAAGG